MLSIQIESQIRDKLPEFSLGCFQADIAIVSGSNELFEEIAASLNEFRKSIPIHQVSKIPMIQATKIGYRVLGKDPSRYRPSAEALTRRILQGKDLYQINSLVDSLNLFSIITGISIGGYDLDKINGDIRLSLGTDADKYEAIGRGQLNIENLLVLRDNTGAFGSPTSDSLRTMITEETTRFLLVFFNFLEQEKLEEILEKAEFHFSKFNHLENIEFKIIN